MTYLGELISIGVAFSWTATALLSEFGSKRLGNLTLNVLRMAFALLFSIIFFWVLTDSPLPPVGSMEACGWMLLSGLVGYVIGDFCLFQCYIIIGSRYGQLFMTLAPLAAALMAWITLGQQMAPMSIVAMFITLIGIGISERCTLCRRCCSLPGNRLGAEQDWYGSLRNRNNARLAHSLQCQLSALHCRNNRIQSSALFPRRIPAFARGPARP